MFSKENTIYTISFSREKVLRDSKRKFWFRYINKFKGELTKSMPLEFGKMVHDLMEHVLGKPKHLRERIFKNTINTMVNTMAKEDREMYENRLNNIVPALMGILEKYEFIALEEHLKVMAIPLDPQSRVAKILWEMTPASYRPPIEKGITGLGVNGYIDAYVTTVEDGKRSILDWKTGTYSEAKFRGYSKQIQLYTHMKRILGETVDNGKIVWIEKDGFAKDVTTGKLTCKKVFDDLVSNFLDGIDSGTAFCSYTEDCSGRPKDWCEYASVCAALAGKSTLHTDFIKLVMAKI